MSLRRKLSCGGDLSVLTLGRSYRSCLLFRKAPWRWRESFPQFPPGFFSPSFSPLRRRTLHAPLLRFSFSPITKIYGTLASCASAPCSLSFHYAGQCRSVCPGRSAGQCAFLAASSAASVTVRILACSGASQVGSAPAYCSIRMPIKRVRLRPHDGPVYHYRPVFLAIAACIGQSRNARAG